MSDESKCLVLARAAGVDLAWRHGEWHGRCPLHEDRRPSFRVRPDRDQWYCQPCGRGGGYVDLAQALRLDLETFWPSPKSTRPRMTQDEARCARLQRGEDMPIAGHSASQCPPGALWQGPGGIRRCEGCGSPRYVYPATSGQWYCSGCSDFLQSAGIPPRMARQALVGLYWRLDETQRMKARMNHG